MDIYTGEIIAMASSPTYDPNKFTHGIGHKDWGEIRDDPLKPLVNKSIAGLYYPGSTFKEGNCCFKAIAVKNSNLSGASIVFKKISVASLLFDMFDSSLQISSQLHILTWSVKK